MIDKNKIESFAKTEKLTLSNLLSDEAAKENNITVYINMDYKQIIGREIYDFVLLSQRPCPVYGEHSGIIDTIYILILWSNGILFEAEICQEEYDGTLFKREQQETLLVRSDVIRTMAEDNVFSYAKKYSINLHRIQFTDTDILTGLSEVHAICGYRRNGFIFEAIMYILA